MSETQPLVYLVLGAFGSGRRAIVADLMAGGLDAGTDVPVVFTAATEAQGEGLTWDWTDDGEIAASWPAESKVGFFLADGRADPTDQIEAFKGWMVAQGVELARVICVVHCRLLQDNPPLMHWYDACIHFSDIVLLAQRDGVANKWISDYQARFTKRCLPCLVELVKKDRVKNPALVLDLQVRRMSHWFDEDEDDAWKSYATDPDTIIIDEDGGDAGDDEAETEIEDEYLARHSGGSRQKVIPDIREYLRDV
jgi:hypothetical protein